MEKFKVIFKATIYTLLLLVCFLWGLKFLGDPSLGKALLGLGLIALSAACVLRVYYLLKEED